jgi:hypothetical protein
MKFTFKKRDDFGDITLNFKGDTLEEVVSEFELFLKACGYDLGTSTFALVNFNQEVMDEEFDLLFDEDSEDDGNNGSGETH